MGSVKKKQRVATTADQFVQNPQHLPVISGTNKTRYFYAFLLIAAAALLYGHSLWNPLVFDDAVIFVDATLERLGSSFFHLDLRWFPYASFGWTYNLVGQDWFWYRLGNVALHALTSILLFVFFSRLLEVTMRPLGEAPPPRWLAFFAALIFVLHPIAVYGVAYLVQRSIIMATLFGIAALLCYLEGLIKNKAWWFVGSAFLYFLAVFSKEHSIMIPAVAAALTLLLHKPSLALIRRVWLPFALYLVIGVLILLRTKGLLGTTYEYLAAEMLSQLSDQQQEIKIEHAYGLSMITQGYLFFKYLLLWVVPYTGWMAIDIRQPFATHFFSWPQLPGFILFFAYPVLAMKWLLNGGRRGLLGFGLLFPWILYLTELSTVRIQEPFVLYRSYLWMSGLPVILFSFMGVVPKRFALTSLAAICLVLASLAWNRLDTFSSDLKLWTDAINKYRGDYQLFAERIYNNRGMANMKLGEFKKAEEDFIQAVTLNPKYAEAYLNLGAVNFELQRFPAALENYNTAINLKPDFAAARINRSTLLLKMGRYVEALNDCEYALQLEAKNVDAVGLHPGMAGVYVNCNAINIKLGRHEATLHDLDQAIQIDPKNATLYYKRGMAHGAMRRYREAMQDYSQAITLYPDFADAYIQRGGLYMLANSLPQAIREFDRAIQINPQNPLYYLNRGASKFNLGKFQEALNDYDKATRIYEGGQGLDADYYRIMFFRGFTLNALNRKSEAKESFRKGCDGGNSDACKQLH